MVANGALHGGQAVRAIVGTEQQQHALRLTPTIALFFQQSLEEPIGDFAQFAEPLPHLLQLAAMVLGRAMPRIHLFLSRLSAEQ